MDSTGYNTDYRAAMDCLQEALATQNTLQKLQQDEEEVVREDELFRGRGALILGAGGVARAIAYGLRQRGAIVAVANRSVDRADELARAVGGRALPWASRYDIRPGIIINCTPVGMHPDVDRTPYDQEKLDELQTQLNQKN